MYIFVYALTCWLTLTEYTVWQYFDFLFTLVFTSWVFYFFIPIGYSVNSFDIEALFSNSTQRTLYLIVIDIFYLFLFWKPFFIFRSVIFFTLVFDACISIFLSWYKRYECIMKICMKVYFDSHEYERVHIFTLSWYLHDRKNITVIVLFFIFGCY